MIVAAFIIGFGIGLLAGYAICAIETLAVIRKHKQRP